MPRPRAVVSVSGIAALLSVSVVGNSFTKNMGIDNPILQSHAIMVNMASRGNVYVYAPTCESKSLTVVVLGTSISRGVGADRTYLEVFVDSAAALGCTLHIRNHSRAGILTRSVLKSQAIPSLSHVDLVIVELGANDALARLRPVDIEFHMLQIVRELKKRAPRTPILVLGFAITKDIRDRFVVDSVYVSAYNEIFRRVAKTTRAFLAPAVLKGIISNPSLTREHGIHPNDPGHEIIGNRLWPIVRRILQSHGSCLHGSG